MDGKNRETTFEMNAGEAGEIRVLAAAVAAMLGYRIVPDAGRVETARRPDDALENVLEKTGVLAVRPGAPDTGTPKS